MFLLFTVCFLKGKKKDFVRNKVCTENMPARPFNNTCGPRPHAAQPREKRVLQRFHPPIQNARQNVTGMRHTPVWSNGTQS